ncbi:hypothetical protein VTN96DRAFT_9238 [Rasamsonia emersonii]
MATTASRRPSVSANGDYVSRQQRAGNGVIRTSSTRRQQSTGTGGPAMDYQDDYQNAPSYPPAAPEAPRAPPISYRNGSAPAYHGHDSRSFSSRTRDLPSEDSFGPSDDGYDATKTTRNDKIPYQRPPEPRRANTQPLPDDGTPAAAMSSNSLNQSQRSRKASDAVSPHGSGTRTASLSRSSTVRSANGETRLSADRSPLQQLEVTLQGLSKEEKRARVVEAEMRLKEQIARRQSQRASREEGSTSSRRTGADNDSTAAASSVEDQKLDRSVGSKQSDVPRRSTTVESKRPEQAHISAAPQDRGSQDYQYARKQPATTRTQAPVDVQYASVQAARQPQYASTEDDGRAAEAARDTGRPQTGYEFRSYSMDNSFSAGPFRTENTSHRAVLNQPFAGGPATSAGVARTNSKKLQKRRGPEDEQQRSLGHDGQQLPPRTQVDQTIGLGSTNPQDPERTAFHSKEAAGPDQAPAGVTLNKAPDHQQDTKNDRNDETTPSQQKPKKQTVSFDVPPPTPPPLSEWRDAPVARLRLANREFEHFDADKGKAWWERGGSSNRRQSRALPSDYRKPPPKVNERSRFEPPLFLKCGPLLRFLGIRRTKVDGPSGPIEQEVWRGSIMIVTADSRSSYEPPPTLRLFAQPMDLLPPPPREISGEEGVQLPPEYVDPTAGLIKVGRDGRKLYVKPVDHVDEAVDLSRVESEDGLYEESPSPIDYSSDGPGKPVPTNRIHPIDGEKSGQYEQIEGFRLYADPARDVTFWRFNIEVELGDKQERIAYRINEGPAIGFWVPGRGQSMNIMFHSGNGFGLSVDPNKFSGPDPLWRDVLNEHQTRPFHVMIGGGDQIYNDNVVLDSKLFQEWTQIKNPQQKYHAPFTAAMKAELETFFLERYAMWFSQGLFSLANCQIPMVNIWNDHDIIGGFGSYPDPFMRAPVISGLGNVAYKYYLLFQHQSVPEETEADEPSWLLGADPGPYIQEKSRSVFMSLGKNVFFLGLDCRTERMRDEILSEQTCDLIWDRCHREIVKGETKHLIVLLSVPIAYPRLVWLENLLFSRVMDPVKALGKAGIFSGLLNKFDGGVEMQSSLDDHWTAKMHKIERTWLIEDLQDLAADKSVRVTILSGDVQLAAIGQFYSNPKLNVAKDKDYRYMPNVISSAIANAPAPEMLSDVLNKRNKIHHMDSNTDEDMIPIFTHDVDGKPRNNKRLLPRRNWCSIREYQPGLTPPSTPPEPASPPTPELAPGKLRRTLSLGRGENRDNPRGGLLRRLSQRGPPPTKDFNLEGARQRRVSMDGPRPPAPGTGNSYFPAPEASRPAPFHRRPTNLSQKAAKKATAEGNDGLGAYINLEGGLDITLNLEVNPKDPSGITTPYRLLVPALWYDGGYDPQPTRVVKGWKKWLGRGKKKNDVAPPDEGSDGGEDGGKYEEDEFSESEEEAPSSHFPQHIPQRTQGQPPEGLIDNELEIYRPKKKWFRVR